jgi:hypothetical protein
MKVLIFIFSFGMAFGLSTARAGGQSCAKITNECQSAISGLQDIRARIESPAWQRGDRPGTPSPTEQSELLDQARSAVLRACETQPGN